MWYLAINRASERFYLKDKKEDFIYVIPEAIDKVEIRPLQELKDEGFTIVGECFDHETLQLEDLLTKGGINL